MKYLEEIVAAHRSRVRPEGPAPEAISAAAASPPTRGFSRSLQGPGLAVIAECKRRSPSKGNLDEGLEPAQAAGQYETGGAAALSVLTDEEFFGARPGDLGLAREAVAIPVLRKDFTVCEADVYEARAMGADAILLIAAVLSDGELRALLGLATELGLDALVETHDEAELERALAAGAKLVGVNQRDLSTFEVDFGRALRLAPLMPQGCVAVAESGIRGPDDARRLADAGYDAILVGEHLLRSADRTAAVAQLVAAGAGRLPLSRAH